MLKKEKQLIREELLKNGPPKCESDRCDNKVEFNKRSNNWNHYCCWKCRGYHNSKKSREKTKLTFLEKYGVESQFHSKEVKEKIKKTNLEKYGVENVFATQEVKEKIKKTNLEKYGVENVSHNKDIQQKIENTMRVRYGVKAPSQNDEIRQKQMETLIKNYGVMYPMQSEIIKQRVISNNIEKYGRTSPTQIHLSDEIISIINDPIRIKEINDKMPIPLIVKTYGGSESLWVRSLHKLGIKPKVHYFSSGEIDVYNELCKIIPPELIQQRNKNFISTEVDILIPSHSLAIEYNGLYWHSENAGVSKDYHLNKTVECERKHVKLLHIFEHEWKKKKDIYKSIILSNLNNCERQFARKLILKRVDKKLEKQFLNHNHFQGYVKSNICYGLFNTENKLICLMSFGNARYNKNYQFELLRYCCLLNTCVIGGASKLFSNFIKKHHPESIISYCHRHLFSGNVYKKIGMTFSHYTKPAYWYTSDYDSLLSRVKFQKHKLKNILPFFDPNLTEVENMKNNGYDRIWDCGSSVWSWKK
jgi:hypothetical protein